MSILQRKATAGRQEHQARAMSVPKAMRLSVAKAADKLLDLALAVIAIKVEQRDWDELGETLDEKSLLLLLDGPDGKTGAAVVGQELVGALIQHQTTGRVAKTPIAERMMTETDAALCAPLLVDVFARAVGLLDSDADKQVLQPYAFGSRSENPRLLSMALDAPEYHVIRMTIDIAGGVHQSALVLCLPVAQTQTQELTEPGENALGKCAQKSLEGVVMSLETELTAVLGRLRLPLARISQLSPGDTLDIPADGFAKTQLVTSAGRVIARGALGQVDGMRALQLTPQKAASGPPMRRNSDRSDLDLPDADPFASTVSAMPQPDAAMDMSDMADLPMDGLPELAHTADLPALDGLPQLEELADLSDASGAGDSSEFGDIPDLSDLPDLADLPDLDLPKAGAG